MNPNLLGEPPSSPRWTMIRKKLEAAKPRLQIAGKVFERQRGNGQWVVRYLDRVHGKRTYRCIFLGDTDMVERTRELLQQWRAERIMPQERQL